MNAQALEARRIMRRIVQKMADFGCSDTEIARLTPGLQKQVNRYVWTGRWDTTSH